jgi:hypothetical protein
MILHYEDALMEAGMESLYTRRQTACNKLFIQILKNPNHKLHNLIPKIDTSLNYQLRNNKKVHVQFRNSILNVLRIRMSSLVV